MDGAALHRDQILCAFFFNDTATTEIYTLSLHDALPIFRAGRRPPGVRDGVRGRGRGHSTGPAAVPRVLADPGRGAGRAAALRGGHGDPRRGPPPAGPPVRDALRHAGPGGVPVRCELRPVPDAASAGARVGGPAGPRGADPRPEQDEVRIG